MRKLAAIFILFGGSALGQIAITNPWNTSSGPSEPWENQWVKTVYDPTTQRTLHYVLDHALNSGGAGSIQSIFSIGVWQWNDTSNAWTLGWDSPATDGCSQSSPTGPVPHHPYGEVMMDTLRSVLVTGPGPCSSGGNTPSSTSLTIGTGSKTLTIASGLTYVSAGYTVVISSGGNTMTGSVTSYAGTTLVANITSTAGSGTFSSWNVSAGATGLPINGYWGFSSTGLSSGGTLLPTTNLNNNSVATATYDPEHDVYLTVDRQNGAGPTLVHMYCPGTSLSSQQITAGCPDNQNWHTISSTATPKGGAMPIFVYDSVATHKAILFGGWDNPGPGNEQNETWKFDVPTAAWTQITTATTPALQNHTGGVVGWAGDMDSSGSLWYMRPDTTSVLWKLDLTAGTPNWVSQTLSGTPPRDPLTAAYDASTGRLVMWSYTGGGFVGLFDAQLPSAPNVTGQFRCLGSWLSGNCKWMEIAGLVTSVSAGSTATVTLTGPSGLSIPLTVKEALYSGGTTGIARTDEPLQVGVPIPDAAAITSTAGLALTGTTSVASANMGTDNGTTLTVATGAATFTIKKANHNGLDVVDVGATHVVLTGTSDGLVVIGPVPGTYPGSVTCTPTSGGTACTTLYKSSNDASSTCGFEKNGPVAVVVKCTGAHKDGSGNAYMAYTLRYYFWALKSYAKVNSSLRNADYGTSSTFATAYKGHRGYEYRLVPNISGTFNYAVAADATQCTSGVCSGTMTTSDSVILYQGQSTFMLDTGNGNLPVQYTPDTGYTLQKNGTPLTSGSTSSTALMVGGFANIQDSAGVGVEIGVYQLSAYGPKSLEFNSGTDVRVGIWARENSIPYYQAWPQYAVHDLYLNFHATALASPQNDFLKFQHYLVAYASAAQYNTAAVFPFPMSTGTAEDAYYTATQAAANPSISPVNGCCVTDINPAIGGLFANRYYGWPAGGGDNQAEFRWADMQNLIKRGMTGRYLYAAQFYRMEVEKTFPRADGFTWRSKGPTEVDQTYGFPTATSANSSLGFTDYIQFEHEHWYGLTDYYFMTGDETINDALQDGPTNYFLEPRSAVNDGSDYNIRAVGAHMMGSARLGLMLNAIGQTTNGAGVLAQGATTYSLQVKANLCVSSYPVGCSINQLSGNATVSGTALTATTGTFNSSMKFAPIQVPNGGAPYAVTSVNSGSSITLGASAGSGSTTWAFNTQGTNYQRGLPWQAGTDDQCLNSTSTDTRTINTGSFTFNTQTGLQYGNSIGQAVVVKESGLTAALFGTITSYNSGAGVLVVNVTFFTGSGTFSSWTVDSQQRAVHIFMTGILADGLLELRAAQGSSWSDYWIISDYLYGVSQFSLNEGYANDGTSVWTNNGFRYNIQMDVQNNCGAGEFMPQAIQAVWLVFQGKFTTEGNTVSSWQRFFNEALQQLMASDSGSMPSDFGQYQVGTVINTVGNPGTKSLQTLTISSFTDNGGGSYTIGWSTPASTDYLRVKSDPLQIVDWIGYNPATGAFVGNPATTANWFAATNAPSIPAPVAGAQSMTITGLATGLLSANFSVKAMAPNSNPGGSLTVGNTISIGKVIR